MAVKGNVHPFPPAVWLQRMKSGFLAANVDWLCRTGRNYISS